MQSLINHFIARSFNDRKIPSAFMMLLCSNYDNCCRRQCPEKFWKFRVFIGSSNSSSTRVTVPFNLACFPRSFQSIISFDVNVRSALTNFMLEKVKKLHFSQKGRVGACTFYWHPHDSSPINNVAPTWRTTYHNYLWNAVSAVPLHSESGVSVACAIADHRQHRRSFLTCTAMCRLFMTGLGLHSCVHGCGMRATEKAKANC